MKLLNGLEVASYIKQRQLKTVSGLVQSRGITPKLAIIRTNPDPVVNSYMKIKTNYGMDIGALAEIHTEITPVIPDDNDPPPEHRTLY